VSHPCWPPLAPPLYRGPYIAKKTKPTGLPFEIQKIQITVLREKPINHYFRSFFMFLNSFQFLTGLYSQIQIKQFQIFFVVNWYFSPFFVVFCRFFKIPFNFKKYRFWETRWPGFMTKLADIVFHG
jgi:hypothetical protein